MENHTGNMANTISEQSDRNDLFARMILELSRIAEQLEPMNQSIISEETIQSLISQLQYISRTIRRPPLTASYYSGYQKKLLQDLQNASIDLLLASDLLKSVGRTRQFYRYLSSCQHCLIQSLERRKQIEHFVSTLQLDHEARVSGNNLQTAIHVYAQEITHSQIFFAHTSVHLFDCDTLHDRFSSLKHALSSLHRPVKELYNTLDELNWGSDDAFFLCSQLQILLSNIDEQIQQLLESINSFHISLRISAKLAYEINQEITRKLKKLQRRCDDLLQAISAVLDQMFDQPRSKRGLYLVKSSGRI
jgi:chromosome segregation ATPase